MERNTCTVSSYIAAPFELAYDYLSDLTNLNEWTLFSRMKERVDDDTWLAASSGYQHDLYYHIRRASTPPFPSVEWHCGIKRGEYFQIYPTFLFRPDYVEPGSVETGVYFHWISFIDPARKTPMIGEGIEVVHKSECRALKAALERRAGLSEAAEGRYEIKTSTIYVDAPIEMGVDYLGDLGNLASWSHLLRATGPAHKDTGEFRDEYDQPVHIEQRIHERGSYYIIEQESLYPRHQLTQRSPCILIPCAYALGNPEARGFMLQRITFWKQGSPPRHGRLQIADYMAESINMKRFLEAKAGNLETFSRGMSYLPPRP